MAKTYPSPQKMCPVVQLNQFTLKVAALPVRSAKTPLLERFAALQNQYLLRCSCSSLGRLLPLGQTKTAARVESDFRCNA